MVTADTYVASLPALVIRPFPRGAIALDIDHQGFQEERGTAWGALASWRKLPKLPRQPSDPRHAVVPRHCMIVMQYSRDQNQKEVVSSRCTKEKEQSI